MFHKYFLGVLLWVVGSYALYESSDVVELTPSNFDELVTSSDDVWIVQFYAPWCYHSRKLVPAYEKAATELKGIAKVGAIDADEYSSFSKKYRISGYPTIMIFTGRKYSKYDGNRRAASLVAAARQAVAEKASHNPRQDSSSSSSDEDALAEKSTEETIIEVQNDVHAPPDRQVFDDADDGSGLETDESSGSGWGAGPGPDDEDGRGSGDQPIGPPDDEDYAPTTVRIDNTPRTFVDSDVPETPEVTDDIDIEEETEPPVPSVEPPIPIDPRQFDVLLPNTKSRPEEGIPEEARGAGEEQPSRPDQTDISITGEDIVPSVDQEPSGTNVDSESRAPDKVVIMNAKPEDRATSFFAQPGILAAVIGGAVVGLLCAILVVMFIVYRMRKKDEGSYALDEPKRSPAAASYGKGHNNREFYA